MKGIILSEFVEFIEQELGEGTAQKIINDSGVKSDGAYSRVGLYDHQELIQLLTQAVAETEIEASVLLERFSDHLLSMFKRDYSLFFDGVGTAAEMLKQIDHHIHVEVQKLYPDAELPTFSYTQNGSILTLIYQSPRPLALVAHSLVGACLKFFGGNEELLTSDIAKDQKSARCTIRTGDGE